MSFDTLTDMSFDRQNR